MSAWAEVVADGTERAEETLGVRGRLEALEDPLPLAGRHVGILGAVSQAFVPPMLAVRKHPSDGRHVAPELIGDHHARFVLTAAQDPSQEALGGRLIAPLLNEDVQDDPVLVDRAPQPVALPANLQQHLVQMPLVAWLCSPAAQVGRVPRAERVDQ